MLMCLYLCVQFAFFACCMLHVAHIERGASSCCYGRGITLCGNCSVITVFFFFHFVVTILHKLRNSQKVQQGNEFERERRSQGAAGAVQIEDWLCVCGCVSGTGTGRRQGEWGDGRMGGEGQGLLAVAASNEFINTKDVDEEKWQTKARMLD